MMNTIKQIYGLLNRHVFWAVPLMCVAWMMFAYFSLPKDSDPRRRMISLVLTPDQQGWLLMKKQDFKTAATIFTSPDLKGVALFKAGQFKETAGILLNSTTPSSLHNRGTALIMAGLYDEAISVLERAAKADPDLSVARINLEIAKIRKEKNLPPEDDHGGTGGKLDADEFVFSDRKSSTPNQETELVEGAGDMNDVRLRELWLRRLESRPKDFLRVKFAYQKSVAEYEGNNKK